MLHRHLRSIDGKDSMYGILIKGQGQHKKIIIACLSQNAERLRTSTGDYWIKQLFSSSAPLFKMGTSLYEQLLL